MSQIAPHRLLAGAAQAGVHATNPRFAIAFRSMSLGNRASLPSDQTPLWRVTKRANHIVATTSSHRWHEAHELTWRRNTENVDLSAQVMTNDAGAANHALARSTAALSDDNTAASNVNQLRQLLAADANFVGRLTNDVVRRIERSVRIDRARRGI